MSGRRRFARMGILLPLFLLLATSVYLAAAFDIRSQFAESGAVGPRTIPILAAILMYVALLVVLVGELRSGAEAEAPGSILRPALVALATAVYILAFRPLGYTIATALYVGALFLIFQFETRRPLVFIGYLALVTLLFYGLFAVVFDVRLPPVPRGLL